MVQATQTRLNVPETFTRKTRWTPAGELTAPDPDTREQEAILSGEDDFGNCYSAYGTYIEGQLVDVYDVCQVGIPAYDERDFLEWVGLMEDRPAEEQTN